MYCLTMILLPPGSVRCDFIPFTCRQWVQTSMIKTGRTPMTAALSKTERSILHGKSHSLLNKAKHLPSQPNCTIPE